MMTPVFAKAAMLQVLLEGPGLVPELRDRAARRTGDRFRPGDASVYSALDELVREGLVHAEPQPPGPRPGRPQKRYEMTDAGRELALEHRRVVTLLYGFEPEGSK